MAEVKVVLDSNVYVSGLLWVGAPHTIIKLAENKEVFIFASPPIIEEVADVLAREKFKARLEALKANPKEMIESLLDVVEMVHPIKIVNAIKVDPDDNRVLECALAAGVDYVVTGDAHLLKLKVFDGVPIITPDRFVKERS